MASDERKQLFRKPVGKISELMRIVQIVADRQRNMPKGRGVLPVTVQAFLDVDRPEQTLRRDMTFLWRAGYLERMGASKDEKGVPTRRGYRVVDDG
jgi:hypothetical protein